MPNTIVRVCVCVYGSYPAPIDAFRKVEVHKIAAGARHSMAVTYTGEMYSWGYSHNGETGHGDRRPRLEPWLIMPLRQWQVQEMAGGMHHSLIIATQRTQPIRKLFERERVRDAEQGKEGFQVPDGLSDSDEGGDGASHGTGTSVGDGASATSTVANPNDGEMNVDQEAGEGVGEAKGSDAGQDGDEPTTGDVDGKAGDDGDTASQAAAADAPAPPELQPLYPARTDPTKYVVTNSVVSVHA